MHFSTFDLYLQVIEIIKFNQRFPAEYIIRGYGKIN